ncbi:MAG: hypothetical protein OXC48_06955 [Endozoicomonadaceae bacterium]|nr:hypothetical protein [Endozoicomonadaceae bacterium]
MKSIDYKTLIIVGLCFIGIGYILSAAYLGVNGNHAWRQSDVYAHILGFLHYKNFMSFDLFQVGTRAVFDIPIYQYLIALGAKIFSTDPLVFTRFFNALLWGVSVYFGYRFLEDKFNFVAPIIFLFLMATTPLVLHYYSVPLPDLFSIALSITALFIIDRYQHKNSQALFVATFLLIVATLIKSPVPFVFIIFYSVYLALETLSETKSLMQSIILRKRYLIILACVFVTAVLAEQLRMWLLGTYKVGFAQDCRWYFGSLDLRASANFWKKVYNRLRHAGPFNFALLCFVVGSLSLFMKLPKKYLFLTFASVTAFLAGWLTFSNVYFVHDYYELPVTIVAFIAFSVSLSWVLIRASQKIKLTQFRLHQPLILVVVFLLAYVTFFERNFSERQKVNFFKSVEYALKDTNNFLFVDSSKITSGPTVGGFLSTKFKQINLSEFESGCSDYLKKYKAILINGSTSCMPKNLSDIDQYIKGKTEKDSYTFIKLQ